MAQPPGEQPAIERPREAWRPADLARLVFFLIAPLQSLVSRRFPFVLGGER
jgi:hypothetical protein